ncbi:MAG: transcriptional regulator [Zunongwangia sp.]|uniref:ArsR/SmtB family transcription factor n=1 Tax=Zunongwangia profunda TaxID=398743 RepID=UPI000C92E1E3|nr:metalloregulator ArsR/SmtB family transcription factor [Zunongwangia profunda]MAO35626.1 transcriptional regulator [Zunongwangia sp.]MCC4230122.1 metalloregulator ArsR/SmtB family transcription factor [Zunongwangia profunda]
MELKQVEKITKALGDRNRLLILKAIRANDGNLDCSAIVTSLELTQPSVSHHIKKLTEADIILAHKEGRFYSYSINEKLLDNYVNTLKNL